MLTFGDAKKLLAKYAGVGGYCSNSSEVDLFVLKVLQYLLYSSASQDLRRYDFCAVKGVFTVPEEVESIQKIKIDGKVGNVWDKWFSYHNTQFLDGDCLLPDNAIFEDPNYYPTAYDLPSCGAKVGVLGHCEEDPSAYVIIQGKDVTGREIYTNHKGQEIAGEYLSICRGTLKTTQVTFGQITNVIKSRTKGYATLYSFNPDTNCRGFLSDYPPLEERPTYRRYKLTTPNCGNLVKVSILARIRLKSAYADTDKIPFENLLAMEVAAQAINANFNNDMQSAAAKNQFMETVISKEQMHKRVQTGTPINIAPATSPGRIQNIVSPFRGFGWRRS